MSIESALSFLFLLVLPMASKALGHPNGFRDESCRMQLDAILEKHQATLVKRWFDKVVDTYPADTRRFIKAQKDPFANPVGQTTLNSLRALFDAVLHDMDRKAVIAHLDPVIRIRAVQAFTPSQAVSFVPALKGIVADQLGKQRFDEGLCDQWQAMDARIDALVLIAFDIYMQCREKLADLKVNLERDRIYQAMTRAGLIKEIEPKPETGVTAIQP